MSRRSVLTGAAALAVTGCVSGKNHDPVNIGDAPLKNRGAAKGIRVGASVRPRLLSMAAYRDLLVRDVDMLVPVNALKWGRLERRRGAYRFRGADTIASFAADHGMAMRGHTLLWHNQIPNWLPSELNDNRSKSAKLIANHIETVAGRYRRRMYSWDVINEAFEPKDGRFDGLRDNLFLQALGPDYIELAFRAAAQADPNARLVLNDYGYEWGWEVGRQRRLATLRLLEKLLKQNIPIHALGIQGHLDPGRDGAMDMDALGHFCDDVADLGLSIEVTELDARDTSINGSLIVRDNAVADAYARFLEVVLARKATKAVLTWGITDRYSWLTRHFPRPDGDMVRGLPYSAEFKRKPAWYAFAAALDAAPSR